MKLVGQHPPEMKLVGQHPPEMKPVGQHPPEMKLTLHLLRALTTKWDKHFILIND
jgi:hypothetical protein